MTDINPIEIIRIDEKVLRQGVDVVITKPQGKGCTLRKSFDALADPANVFGTKALFVTHGQTTEMFTEPWMIATSFLFGALYEYGEGDDVGTVVAHSRMREHVWK